MLNLIFSICAISAGINLCLGASIRKSLLRTPPQQALSKRDGFNATVAFDAESNKYTVSFTQALDDPSVIGYGSYSSNFNNSGWNYLDITATNKISLSDEDYLVYMKGMGFLEGVLTCEDLFNFYPNFYYDTFDTDEPPYDVANFIQQNYDWVREMAYKNDSAYWKTIRGTMAQLDGFVEGFGNSSCADAGAGFSLTQLLYINAWGDLYTIQSKFMLEKASDEFLSSRRRGDRRMRLGYPRKPELPKDLRCSSLFRLLPDYSDILFSHTTWDGFVAAAPRIFKRYILPVPAAASSATDAPAAHKSVHFSSSPGLLSSVDDFYIVYSEENEQAQLAVIETTNEVYVFDDILFALILL